MSASLPRAAGAGTFVCVALRNYQPTGEPALPQDSTYIALTHAPSPAIVDCELTYVERSPIDFGHALQQHAAYCELLADCGAEVHTLTANIRLADSVFIEDTALVLDEVAIIASPGAESRRPEPAGIEPELRKYRECVHVPAGATFDGGDVVVLGRTIFVGLSSRSNAAGVQGIRDAAGRFGYAVKPVRVTGCLHLKSATTALPDGRLLVNPVWLERSDLDGFAQVEIDASEQFAGDVALVGDTVIAGSQFPRTNARLAAMGYAVRIVDLSEFAKAEGGVTCLSLIFRR